MKDLNIIELFELEEPKQLKEPMDDLTKLKYLTELKEKDHPFLGGVRRIEYTKFNEPVLLIKPIDLDEYGLIYRLYNGINHFRINLINDDDILEIADVEVLQESEFRKGYGSFLIQEAIKFAKSQKKNKICGYMVYKNEEQHQRQISFYKKNGFTILEDEFHFEMILN